MNFLHVLTIALLFSGSRMSAMFATVGAIARSSGRLVTAIQRAQYHDEESFKQIASFLREGNGVDPIQGNEHANIIFHKLATSSYKIRNMKSYVNYNYPRLLEIASGLDQIKCVRIILAHAAKNDIPIKVCYALHRVKSQEVAQLLLDAGIDVNVVPERGSIPPLHMTPNALIPFLLKSGARADIEAIDRLSFAAFWLGTSHECGNRGGYDLLKNHDIQEWRATEIPSFFVPGSVTEGYAESGRLSTNMIHERLQDILSKNTLINRIRKHVEISSDYDRGFDKIRYDLSLTAPAYAAYRADIERTETFLIHVQPEIMLPQIEKARFIAQFMQAFFPHKKTAYRICAQMLTDYEREHATRVLETPHALPKENK